MLKRLAGAVAMVLLLPALATAQTPKKDLQLFERISRAILSDPQYTVFDDLSARVDEGVVTLTGKVTMPYKADSIVARVERLPGVTAVRNEIEVLPVSITDAELRHVLVRRVYGNPTFWVYGTMVNPPIHIVVEHGRVTLTGVVNSEVERALARSVVSGTFGVFAVDNQLKTDAEMEALGVRGQ